MHTSECLMEIKYSTQIKKCPKYSPRDFSFNFAEYFTTGLTESMT